MAASGAHTASTVASARYRDIFIYPDLLCSWGGIHPPTPRLAPVTIAPLF